MEDHEGRSTKSVLLEIPQDEDVLVEEVDNNQPAPENNHFVPIIESNMYMDRGFIEFCDQQSNRFNKFNP
jgi:hypothetical protein